ncbi:MAG: allantoicase [Deltaproteobacteria bacterium]|nr:allantoicase [Deltaproteobacteria bacterium]
MSVDLAAFADCTELASESVGGAVLAASDDFFAEKENLLKVGEAEFDPHAYTERGKLMDGWESRRKRVSGNDWAIVRLGVPGLVRGLDIDTSWFLGNHPPFSRLEGIVADPDADAVQLANRSDWFEVLPQVPLKSGSHNLFAASQVQHCTHLRLWMLPDGGIARLRVYGDPAPRLAGDELLDLAALVHGARALAASDMFFGNKDHLIQPGRAENMGGGWETRRRRDTGHDWIVVQLAGRGTLARLVLDTHHFKGNFPDRCSVQGLDAADAEPFRIERRDDWVDVLPETKMAADTAHSFEAGELQSVGPFTHLRLKVHPCGGVSRLRAMGSLVAPQASGPADLLNGLDEAAAHSALMLCCGSEEWATRMTAARPFADDVSLMLAADEVWWNLPESEWLAAFAHHPRIGEDPERLRRRFGSTAEWAGGEQAGVAGAAEQTLSSLVQGNHDYEARYGHVFLICATGLSAHQMLSALQRRLPNDPARERLVAAGEQAKITRLRLHKLDTP